MVIILQIHKIRPALSISEDCQYDDWGECEDLKCRGDGLSRSMGIGTRHRKIKIAAERDGKDCKDEFTKSCEAPCPGIQ